MITRPLLAFLLSAFSFLAACQEKLPANELVVGMDLSYPPFETIDPKGQPSGVSFELAKALAEDLKRPLRIENQPFTGLIPSLQNGRLDCIISSMTDTPERRQSVAFSDPYLSIGLALLVGKDSAITSLSELDQPGRTFVVRQGTTGEVWARKNLSKATLLSLDKENAAVLEVIQGKADAFIYDQMSVWQNAQKNPDSTRALLEPVQKESWAIALRQDSEDLRIQINKFLEEYRARGGFEKLGDTFLKDQKEAFQKDGIPFYF